jgi:DNA-directed RNA polymerase sigma subunit (sigma70/sigma32)
MPTLDDVCGLPISVEQAALMADAYRKLPRRSRYVLTVRLGLGVGVRSCRQTATPLGISAEGVVQVRGRALDVLRSAGCGGVKASPAHSEDSAISLLRRLAR